ncbi:hypothetical protein KO489_02560 [Reinekea forsetii]|nr:hypothetical protein [Reinekea forsetii]
MINQPHGQTEISVSGRILQVSYFGQFNLEGITSGLSKQRKVIESFNGEPFAVLIDDKNIQGGTPEAYQALEEFNQWVNSQYMVAKAMLFKSNLQLKILDSLVESRKDQNIKTFSDKKEALHWLNSELTKATNSTHHA